MQPGRLMPGHSTRMQQPENIGAPSLYFGTIYAKLGVKPSRVDSVLVPPRPALQAGRGPHGRRARETARSPFSASVGDSGGLTWAGGLG